MKDPFVWSDDPDALQAAKGAGIAPCRGFSCRETGRNHIHLVIGPDLVSEWRAKNKKK